jgi:hypothetical protein
MEDQVINFYSKLDNNHKSTHPKTWKNHHIYNNSMILCMVEQVRENQTHY